MSTKFITDDAGYLIMISAIQGIGTVEPEKELDFNPEYRAFDFTTKRFITKLTGCFFFRVNISDNKYCDFVRDTRAEAEQKRHSIINTIENS
jgi:hypothetical protein